MIALDATRTPPDTARQGDLPMSDLRPLLDQLEQDGFLVLPDALAPDQVGLLRDGVERAFATADEECRLRGGLSAIWRPRLFEHGEPFEEVIDNPRVIDLVEAILGPDCHLIANSALKTGPGEGISGWHADETVRFPRPRDVPLDPRIPLPCLVLNFNYYLCDVDEALGPTQFVPGSHRSGRQPEPEDLDQAGQPHYAGRVVFSAVGTAGTAVMWNDQTWHRGAVNQTTDRWRYVLQAPYGRRWISQRFWPFVNYRLPDSVVERANSRRRRLLGLHGFGAYG